MLEPVGDSAPRRWWFERELFAALLIVSCAYFLRIGALSIRGEEPRLAQVAFEMRHFDDWFVPREQGELFFSRPPLHAWVINCSVFFLGDQPWALRFPSVIAFLLISVLIYGYTRQFLPRSAAFMTALVFPTMGEMFQTGPKAEQDPLFILFISASLLLWHWGYSRKWRPIFTWIAGYGCMALAGMSKGGLQPPVYFLGTVGVFLFLKGDLRFFFRWSQLGGVAVAAAVIGTWFVPYYLRYGWHNAYSVWMVDTAARFRAWNIGVVLMHLIQYPTEVLGCMLPWSIALLGFLRPSLRRWIRASHPEVLFVVVAIGVAFPTCWLPPGGLTRYFAPLYPCLSVLIGYVIYSAFAPDRPPAMQSGWRAFVVFVSILMAVLTVAVPACAIFMRNGNLSYFATPWPTALLYSALLAGLVWATFRYRQPLADVRRVRTVVVCIAGFMIIFSMGVLTDLRIRRSADTAEVMAQLKQELPPGQRLYSFGHIEALFAYHYGQVIEPLHITKESDVPVGMYFCFDAVSNERPPFPFPWREIRAVSMDRNITSTPDRYVVVGVRLPETKVAQRTIGNELSGE